MNITAFENGFKAIQSLNASEGPRRNVLEPKFQARDQMVQLLEAVQNAYAAKPDAVGLSQLCRCFVFLAINLIETDEEKEGVERLQQAFTIVERGAVEELVEDGRAVTLCPLDTVLTTSDPFISEKHHFVFCSEFMEVLNALGMYFSNRTATQHVNDAKKVLHVAEAGYKAWDAWFNQQENSCTSGSVPVTDEGSLDEAAVPQGKLDAYRLRLDMDNAYTSTVFYLAQVYVAINNGPLAAQYCHQTLHLQLISRKEFSRKAWAKNALQVSSYYSSQQEFGKALHCLEAGEYMMPKENPDEDTLGFVAWCFGKFYLRRLTHYAQLKSSGSSAAAASPLGPNQIDLWWQDFDLPIPPQQKMPPITTFDEARDTFKLAKKWLDEAKVYYKMDGCCGDHIVILQELSDLYRALIAFEPNVPRKIAMHQRRAELLEWLPDELNFQAYATTVRQLLLDVGAIYDEIMDLTCGPQAVSPASNERVNKLVDRTMGLYKRFCATFEDRDTKKVPEVLESDYRLPYFRSLLHIAQLERQRRTQSTRELYECTKRALEYHEDVMNFVKSNPLPEEAQRELSLAKETMDLVSLHERQLCSRLLHSA